MKRRKFVQLANTSLLGVAGGAPLLSAYGSSDLSPAVNPVGKFCYDVLVEVASTAVYDIGKWLLFGSKRKKKVHTQTRVRYVTRTIYKPHYSPMSGTSVLNYRFDGDDTPDYDSLVDSGAREEAYSGFTGIAAIVPMTLSDGEDLGQFYTPFIYSDGREVEVPAILSQSEIIMLARVYTHLFVQYGNKQEIAAILLPYQDKQTEVIEEFNTDLLEKLIASKSYKTRRGTVILNFISEKETSGKGYEFRYPRLEFIPDDKNENGLRLMDKPFTVDMDDFSLTTAMDEFYTTFPQ